MAKRTNEPDALLRAQIAALEATGRARVLTPAESRSLENLLLRQYLRERRLRLKIERASARLAQLGSAR